MTIRVLFLCTGNSARSIIGAALLQKMGGKDFEVFSAGTAPKGINPLATRVLAAEGIDVSQERSKSVTEFTDQQFDYLITVCDDAAEQCPVFPGVRHNLHWSFPDPAAVQGTDGEKLQAFKNTVEGMRDRLLSFIPEARAAGGGG